MSLKRNVFLMFAIAAALVGAVFFCPEAYAASEREMIFKFQDKTFVYDASAVRYDERDRNTVAALMRRGFFGDEKSALDVANEAMGLGFDSKTAICFVFPGIDKTVNEMKRAVEKPRVDSKVSFRPDSKTPFSFSESKDGRKVDEEKLFCGILKALQSGQNVVNVPTYRDKAVTAAQNKKNTSLKSQFSTSYSNSSDDRKSNVRLALSRFNGLVVPDGARVSFNAVVGKRTKDNGFKTAKVIENGLYVDGVGGGVCQASTTLYNAALLAGLKVEEWHRHTLKSSYVKPSFDAMVNDNGADLVFVNDSGSALYFKTICDENTASVFIFGAPNEFEIERLSKVTRTIKAATVVKADNEGRHVTFDDEQVFLRRPVDGACSEGYLIFKKEGKEAGRVLLRKDSYKKVDGLAAKGVQKRPKTPQNEQNDVMHNDGDAA